jgi:hypothetical protein
MTHHQHPEDTVDRQRVIDEAQASIEQYRRLMADAGLTPESCLEILRRAEGAEAVAKVERDAAEVLRNFKAQTARDVFHATPERLTFSRRVATRRLV